MSQDNRQQQVMTIDTVRLEMAKNLSRFRAALPPTMEPEKFLSVVITAINKNQDLLKCTPQSLFNAALKCAQDGLLPDGKEAIFIQYGREANYQAMVGGVFKKLRNSGEISLVLAEVVYQGDEFSVWTDENGRHLRHVPNLSAIGRGKEDHALYVYALAKVGGEVDYEVLNKEEVTLIRSKSKSPNGTTWKEWWGEMAKKSVVRRFSKRLPMSAEAKSLIERDDEDFDLSKSPAPAKSLSEQLAGDFGAFNESHGNGAENGNGAAEKKEVIKPKTEAPKEKDADPESFGNFQGGPVGADPRQVK